MGLFGDIGGLAGGIAGLFSDDGSGDAEAYYKQLAAKAGQVDPTVTAQEQGKSELGAVDPGSRNAEMDALRELQTQYRSGGLDAQGKGALAQAETEANRQATARSNAIGEQARASNMGNSGVTLALKQQAGQEAGEQANRASLGAAAMSEGNRMAALGGAATIGGQIRGQDYQAAGAQDSINRYNAMARQAAQQGTFNNRMTQLGSQAGLYGGAYGAAQTGDQRTRAMWTGVGKGVGSLADMAAGSGGGGGAGGAAGDGRIDPSEFS